VIVVADTGPVNYLVLSGQIDLAHDLYGTLLIPPAILRRE
jgi:predicted nucleic acid-binding protein